MVQAFDALRIAWKNTNWMIFALEPSTVQGRDIYWLTSVFAKDVECRSVSGRSHSGCWLPFLSFTQYVCALDAEEFKFDFEEEKLDESALRKLVWDELTHYHPEMRGPAVPVKSAAEIQADAASRWKIAAWAGEGCAA